MDAILSGEGFAVFPLDERELPALLEVYRGCEDFLALGPVPYASAEMVEKDLAVSRGRGGIYCGIYLEGSVLAGVLDFVPDGWQGQAGEAFLELLMLAAPYRNQGLGARVFAALEQHLAAAGVRVLHSGVQANNPAAICFWQRQGLEIVSGLIAMPDGTTCYDTQKKLG